MTIPGVGGELEQHDGGDGRLRDADGVDLLLDAIFEDEEVAGLEAGDELVVLVEDDADVEVDEGNIDAEGVGFAVGVLDLGLVGRGRRRRFVGFLLLGDDDGAVVDGGTAGVRRLRGRWLRGCRGLCVCRWEGDGDSPENQRGEQGRQQESAMVGRGAAGAKLARAKSQGRWRHRRHLEKLYSGLDAGGSEGFRQPVDSMES